ncbi:MAG: flagellar filament capping protein FliD [Pseudomonadota bacterium]|nr:flagellar filament capping protein FliD [Pseudomonadota bacterium]
MAATPEILSKLNIGSGMNNSEIIAALVNAEKAPVLDRIEKDETQTQNKISAYGILKSEIKTFRDSIRNIRDSNAASHVGSSSNTTIATFTTTGSTGSDEINSSLVVSSLASTHTLASAAYDSAGSAVGEGSLTIDFGTYSTTSATNDTFTTNTNSSVTINTSATTSLSQLRDLINNATDNAEASILYNGSGYVIVIKGLSGADNEIRITPSDASTDALKNKIAYNTSSKTLTQTTDGTDANFSVDGLSMTRSSNEINDLFKGYSLKLNATNSSAINISSSQNLSTIEGLLNDFVTSYNAVYGGISALSVAGTTADSSGPLSGDSLARQIQRTLRGYSSNPIAGYEGGPYTLSLLGIQTQRDGTLALNTNTLKNTFEKQPKVIDAVFKNQLNTDTAEIAVTQIGINTKTGSYAISKSGSDFLIDGVAMSADGSVYSSTSGNSSGLKIQISDTSITSANIFYGKSLMSLVDESLTNILAFDGDIQNRLKNLSASLKDFEDQKVVLDERMAKLEQRYAMQDASMETAVAGLKDTGEYLTEMLKSKD